ncbi:hypothetical protein J2Y54_003132 [Sphingomonas sp. BE123]|uniref:hypothetical protein n=1 Tax=Sphingomonas sp. BE123 TaxID=2817842 RepID=UPI0028667880|nr:hypothetical protein [Sphingomonas sp. BE123]MDR6853612.1 hypothetical protein [Sphingomonas sp. BE123]
MIGASSGLNRVAKLLANPPAAGWHSLDAALERLVREFGAAEVRSAALRLTKQKRGRKAERDWPLLQEQMMRDARALLRGASAADLPTNYAIATAFVEQNPGHNPASTHRRIMGKLTKGRDWITWYHVIDIAKKEEPFIAFFQASYRYPDGLIFQEHRLREADRMRGVLERYRGFYGEPPADMTMDAIEAKTKEPIQNPLMAFLPSLGFRGSQPDGDDENRDL